MRGLEIGSLGVLDPDDLGSPDPVSQLEYAHRLSKSLRAVTLTLGVQRRMRGKKPCLIRTEAERCLSSRSKLGPHKMLMQVHDPTRPLITLRG